jgi:hypothetical protein
MKELGGAKVETVVGLLMVSFEKFLINVMSTRKDAKIVIAFTATDNMYLHYLGGEVKQQSKK